MAYQTGVPSSIEDLIDKLFTFLTGATAAWTSDELDLTNNYGTIHKNDCYVSFRWDASPATDLALYQSLGWTTSLLPHQQDDDSGNGTVSIPINSGRRVNFLAAGPFVAYHFFASDTAPYYCHVAVELSSGVYRHFGFGLLDKIGSWTGGEYCYGHYWDQGTSSIDQPNHIYHAVGFESLNGTNGMCPTVHVEDLPGMGVSDKWGVMISSTLGGTDRAGEDRAVLYGGMRSGLWVSGLGFIPTSQLNLYKPLIPIPLAFHDPSTSPYSWYLLGYQPDVAVFNIKNLTPGQEITIGSDTWMVFPWVRKQYLKANTEESWNAGIAYKKVV